jgi:hypothetical protein
MGLVVLAMSLVVSVSAFAQDVPRANPPKAGTAKAAEPKAEDRDSVGNPLAPGLMALVKQEIRDGLRTRGIQTDFQRFCSYTAMKLDNTAGEMSASEVTGNCRLSWYDYLLRHPLDAPAEAEKFTRHLHRALRGNHEGVDQALVIARGKLDCGVREPRTFPKVTSPEQALEVVEQSLCGAQIGYAAALAPLTPAEIAELAGNLDPVFVGNNIHGHTLNDRNTGRRLCDQMEKMDRRGFYNAADALVPLTDPELLHQLKALPEKGDVQVEGASGRIVRKIVTPAGTIVVGGKGKNVYDLDKMRDVAVVIDLGGDDVYREGTVSLDRPVLILIDLGGDDRYEGTKPGIQGGAVLGVSMLVDLEGRDIYRAQDVAQGSALCGVGILVDFAGDDYYAGLRRVQGHALGGLGILLDRAGSDTYRAAMWAQGFGAPLGFGALDDLDGNDQYYVGGLYPDSYPETPGYEGWGQGVGAGLRQVGNGGIGVILDGGGNDVYEYDYIAHGGGYWLGLGFARDFAGNDRRYGGTRKAFGGGQRGEEEFQRFACGFGCHYAMGFCFDDEGDDTYGGTIMGLGFAWDDAVGVLCDFAGNDRYEATGGGTQGNGAQAGLGVLFDYTGNDVYLGYGQGYAAPDVSYHPLPQCGGNFSFVIDYGGNDSYGCGAENNTYNVRGAQGGFLVDRPLPEEAAAEAKKQAAAKKTAETPAGGSPGPSPSADGE